MQVIDNHTIQIDIAIPKQELFRIARGRRNFLHKKLGYVCADCGCNPYDYKKGKWRIMNMHHVFYPLGYEVNWTSNWKFASDDVFYSSYYPEIMEACILLCRACHRKRHGIGKAS